MRIGIGISAGTDVVCAALVVDRVDGTHVVEYRTISADGVNSDTGDLVASAIELVASLAPTDTTSPDVTSRRAPTAIAVSYRTTEQASSIRSALAHSERSVLLVPETAAAHTFLADSGLVARYDSIAVVDLGASGTTASIIAPNTGTVLATDRTERFGGTVADRAVRDLMHGHHTIAEPSLRHDRGGKRSERSRVPARYRATKEHLSTTDSATVGGIEGSSLDRAAFEDALRPHVAGAAEFTKETAATVDTAIDAVVLIGGSANIPLVRSTFESALKVPTLLTEEPDTVLAKGAARLALDAAAGAHAAGGTQYASTYDTVGAGTNTTRRSAGKYSGAVLAALVAGVIVVAYGVQTLTPRGEADVTPAGSTVESENVESETQDAAPEVPVGDALSDATSTRSDPTVAVPSTPPTPTLTPAPDLPLIPWPARSATPELVPETSSGRSATTEPDTTPRSRESSSPPYVTVPSPTDSAEPDPTSSPDDTTAVPPSGEPTESGTPAAPDSTTEVPAGTVESTPTLVPPTTDAATDPTPELTPPSTVWTPPPSSETTATEAAEPVG